MKTLVMKGDVVPFTAGATVISGQVVIVGERVGVAVTDVASGDMGELMVVGCHLLPKVSADDLADGEKVYVTSSGEITSTATSNKLAGVMVGAAGSGATVCTVQLLPNLISAA